MSTTVGPVAAPVLQSRTVLLPVQEARVSSQPARRALPTATATRPMAVRRLSLVIPTTAGAVGAPAHLISSVLVGHACARIPYATVSAASLTASAAMAPAVQMGTLASSVYVPSN